MDIEVMAADYSSLFHYYVMLCVFSFNPNKNVGMVEHGVRSRENDRLRMKKETFHSLSILSIFNPQNIRSHTYSPK